MQRQFLECQVDDFNTRKNQSIFAKELQNLLQGEGYEVVDRIEYGRKILL